MIAIAHGGPPAPIHKTLRALFIGAVVIVCSVAGAVALASAPAQAAPAWTAAVVANPKPLQPHAQFQSVSCPSPTFCLAVGSHVATDGRFMPFAETFNGTSWHISTLSLPGSRAEGFLAVSCTDRTFCVATTTAPGTSQAAVWNGVSWKLQSLGTAHIAFLGDVKCRSHSFCMLIGLVGRQAAAWHYNGKGWYRQTLPSPATHSLNAVSCPSTTVCYAAGSTNSTSAAAKPYVVRWNGKAWHASALPAAAGLIAGISCISAIRCTAVGSRGVNQDSLLVVDLAGGRWTYSPASATKNYPIATEVACTRAACTAILSVYTADESIAGAIAVRGKTGGFVKSTKTFPDLSGLSCTGTSCLVVGSTLVSDRGGNTIGSQATRATSFRRHGTTLTAIPVPQPDGRTANNFSKVSCSGGLCAALDTYGESGGVWVRKSATATWQPVAGTAGKTYSDVSCSSATFCMAVGRGTSLRYDPASGSSAWTSAAIPQPQGKDKDDIFAVSCVSRSWCEAVGTTGSQGAEGKPLAVHWAGAGWAVDHVGTSTVSALDGISCTSSGTCLAVGYKLGNSDGQPRPLAATFEQGTWAATGTAGLPGTALLENVSCWSASGCMVTASGDFGAPAAATWNGTSFTSHPIAGDNPTANDVSCTSATSCTIAGIYFGTNRYGSQLVEHWNGSAWHVIAQPAVTGNQPAYNGISCTSSGSCTAVGYVGRAYDIALVGNGTV